MTRIHYDENPRSVLRPRHPIVCTLDIFGLLLTTFFLKESRNEYVSSYLLSLWFLYFFSTVHHWFAHADWRRKIDHTMIFVVIAMTALPYWGSLFPFEWSPLGPILIGSVIVAGSILKYFSFFSEKMSAVLYTVASVPMWVNMHYFWKYIPWPWNLVFMIAVGLYGLQLCIYTLRWFDFRPKEVGFREYQHFVLVIATTLHSYVALTVVR